ncbi:MAG: aminopeptidase P N-terminal domain-containing protein [Candidatus Babeliales bacterium]
MPYQEPFESSMFQDRRNLLIQRIKEKYPDKTAGIVLLLGNFEREGAVFKQDPSFYYLTGIQEPACALVIDLATESVTLFVPNFGKEREKWMADAIMLDKGFEVKYGVDAIKYLGQPCVGYQCYPFFSKQEYADLLAFLEGVIKAGNPIFTLNPENAREYIEQRYVLQRIADMVPDFKKSLIDVSYLVHELRRTKNTREIELLYKAIDITIDAQYVLAPEVRPGIIEYELEGLINYIFIGKGGVVAFPSIVASGKNSTILHYHHNNKTLQDGELLVVDIGAEYNGYCADITRTYPVSGTFTPRQREIYMMVLDTQEYIANLAKPGYWLSNKEQPDKSLYHLAVAYLAQKGYDKYFLHGIGHFLGIDVHDVGDYKKPLEPGDVITIEPGIYIKEEELGVRIEDDYWVIEDGVVCMSEQLPKHPDDIEQMMKAQHNEN